MSILLQGNCFGRAQYSTICFMRQKDNFDGYILIFYFLKMNYRSLVPGKGYVGRLKRCDIPHLNIPKNSHSNGIYLQSLFYFTSRLHSDNLMSLKFLTHRHLRWLLCQKEGRTTDWSDSLYGICRQPKLGATTPILKISHSQEGMTPFILVIIPTHWLS